jgi:hypothetical protein
MKTPNTKHQIPNKLQKPSCNSGGAGELEFGAWDVFGVWFLVFGVCEA